MPSNMEEYETENEEDNSLKDSANIDHSEDGEEEEPTSSDITLQLIRHRTPKDPRHPSSRKRYESSGDS